MMKNRSLHTKKALDKPLKALYTKQPSSICKSKYLCDSNYPSEDDSLNTISQSKTHSSFHISLTHVADGLIGVINHSHDKRL